MKYKYIRESWKKPVNYNFSIYGGKDFIKSFDDVRNKKISELETLIKGFDNNENSNQSFSTIQSKTSDALNSEIESMIKNNKFSSTIDFYIRKFEIKKLIFNDYNKEGFGCGSHDNLLNYIMLSKACLEAYKLSKNLKYLNTALKLNDILSFFPLSSTSQTNILELKEIFLSEKEIIMSFIK